MERSSRQIDVNNVIFYNRFNKSKNKKIEQLVHWYGTLSLTRQQPTSLILN